MRNYVAVLKFPRAGMSEEILLGAFREYLVREFKKNFGPIVDLLGLNPDRCPGLKESDIETIGCITPKEIAKWNDVDCINIWLSESFGHPSRVVLLKSSEIEELRQRILTVLTSSVLMPSAIAEKILPADNRLEPFNGLRVVNPEVAAELLPNITCKAGIKTGFYESYIKGLQAVYSDLNKIQETDMENNALIFMYS